MSHRCKVLLLISALFISCIYTGIAQSDTTSTFGSLSFTARTHYGFFIANQSKSMYVRDSHSALNELDISLTTTNKHAWAQVNNFLHLGIALLYGRSGGDQYIGHIGAIFPYADFPLVKRNAFTTSFRLGFGLGWVEKPFNAETNTKNLLIGSKFNGCINMALQSEVQLIKHVYLSAGISFTHLSNGCSKLPNLGLNIPAVTAGLRYAIRADEKPVKKELAPFVKKWHYYVFANAAAKQTYPLTNTTYMVTSIAAEALKDFSYYGRFGGGFNVTYDPSLSREIEGAFFIFDKKDPFWQASIYGAYEHVMGKLSIPIQFGMYVYNKYPVSGVYQNIGLRYKVSSHLVASLQLKAHLGKADYIQYGIGYKF
ncbi:MAG: acyloxyacyl hydrolase [Chitinophagaceae bacterium]